MTNKKLFSLLSTLNGGDFEKASSKIDELVSTGSFFCSFIGGIVIASEHNKDLGLTIFLNNKEALLNTVSIMADKGFKFGVAADTDALTNEITYTIIA